MIQVIYDKEKDEIIPVVTCDFCGRQIIDALKGVVVNQSVSNMGKTPTAILHAHKGECHDRAELMMGRQSEWEELSAHLYYLCNNLGLISQWRDRPQEKNDQ